MTEHTIRWCEHRARVGALEDEITRLRSQLDERGEWIVQERQRNDRLREALRRIEREDHEGGAGWMAEIAAEALGSP